MKMDYELLSEIIDDLVETERRIIKPWLMREKSYIELAEQEKLSYSGIRKRIAKIRTEICEDMKECLGYMKIN